MIRALVLSCYFVGALAVRDTASSLRGNNGATGATGNTGATGASGAASNVLGQACAPPAFVSGFNTSTPTCASPDGTTPVTNRVLFVGPSDFSPNDAAGRDWSRNAVSLTRDDASQAQTMMANIHKPLGAAITLVRCWASDAVADAGAPTDATALKIAWSVQGDTCNGAPASCGCGVDPTYSQDNPSLHAITIPLYTGPNPDPECVAATAANLEANGPAGFTQHSIELFTTAASVDLRFFGCEVTYSISAALP